MKKISITIFLIFSSLIAEDKVNLLESAYVNSVEMLSKYSQKWAEASKPISDSEFNLLSDTLKVIYNIYEYCFNPPMLIELFGPTSDYKNYINSPYYVVPSKMSYSILSKIPEDLDQFVLKIDPDKNITINSAKIEDFRPRINIKNKKIIYSNTQFENEIITFLNQPIDTVDNKIDRIDRESRYRFIMNLITVLPAHWDIREWHIETMPIIYSIEVNKNLNEALVYYQIFWGGCVFHIKKNNNTWEILKIFDTWIQ